jgi:hypothetical protein
MMPIENLSLALLAVLRFKLRARLTFDGVLTFDSAKARVWPPTAMSLECVQKTFENLERANVYHCLIIFIHRMMRANSLVASSNTLRNALVADDFHTLISQRIVSFSSEKGSRWGTNASSASAADTSGACARLILRRSENRSNSGKLLRTSKCQDTTVTIIRTKVTPISH